MYQQTVARAINTKTGEVVEALQLFDLSEADFTALRRKTMAERNARRKLTTTEATFICAVCEQPLWLSRRVEKEGNRWFQHAEASPECPYYDKNRLSSEQLRARLYHGEQEGPEHRRLKQFIARWLLSEPGIHSVSMEKTTFGQVLAGEWKRPDVKCMVEERQIVFEIQTNYTFLSEVIKRDEFYRDEGIFIIWVFRALELHRATVADEAFFNRRNLFILDDAATTETLKSERLTFSGHFQEPLLVNGEIEDVWSQRLITLADIYYPTPSYRPFFHDYEAAREAVLDAERLRKQYADAKRQAEERRLYALQQQVHQAFFAELTCYLEAAEAYYESNEDKVQRKRLLEVVERLRSYNQWKDEYSALEDEQFFGSRCVLPVLLSLKKGRAIGYNKELTPYRVLEAGLRQSTGNNYKGFAVLYLIACREFAVQMSDKNRAWILSKRAEVKKSIEAKQVTYRRDTRFDATVCLLFPVLKKGLASNFGIFPIT